MKNDKEVVLAALSQNGYALQYASDTLKNDKEVVLAAVFRDGRSLQFASAAVNNDKNVVLAAMSCNATALGYATDAMKNDKEVVMTAVSNYADVMEDASDELLDDECFVLSMKMIGIRKRFRWPRLIKQAMTFKRHDASFKQLFEPVNFIETVDDAFLDGDDDVGPQASTFWHAIINKRRKLS
jgi:hypothetical protein